MTKMTKMMHTGEGVNLKTFSYERNRSSTDPTSELLQNSLHQTMSLGLYHSMFIVHDEGQDFITQTLPQPVGSHTNTS